MTHDASLGSVHRSKSNLHTDNKAGMEKFGNRESQTTFKKRHSSLKTGGKDDLDHVFDEAERKFKEMKELHAKKRLLLESSATSSKQSSKVS